MDGIKLESQGVSHYSIPMAMTSHHHHQSYANYPVYQHHSHPLGFFGSKYEASGVESVSPVSPPTPPAHHHQSPVKRIPQPAPAVPSPAGIPRKQMRNKYTKEQKSALEQSFLNDGAYVSVRQREIMAEELKLTSKQVKVWYQNRRQKDKRRDMKIRRQQQQKQENHVTVIKVPPSADSPDSGVQDVTLEDHRELIGKGRELTYHETASNQVDGQQQQNRTPRSPTIYSSQGVEYSKYQETSAQQYYSLASQYATTGAAGGGSGAATASSPGGAAFDYSQAFANYYDYRGAYHQYYQQLMMSGYQSQAQQFYASADPQDSQAYSGF